MTSPNPTTEAPLQKAALTVNEFCSTTSISRSVFYEQVDEGRIQVLKLGRRTLVPATEVPAFLNSLSGPRKTLAAPPRIRVGE